MTDQQHPITPPPELVQEWWEEADQYQDDPKTYFDHVATQAARWGADQELEACCADLQTIDGWNRAVWLRSMRRPKPPSLKEQALGIIDDNIEDGPAHISFALEEIKTIRRALEALPND